MKDILLDKFYDDVNKSSKKQIVDIIEYLDTLLELEPSYKDMTIVQMRDELKDNLKNWKDIKRTDP
jgi:hypothetical protein